MAALGIVAFAVTAAALMLDWPRVFDWVARPQLLASMLAVVAYTVQALRLGWIATVGGGEKILHYRRADEPALFWLLVVFYLVLAIPAACLLAGWFG